MVRLSMDMHTLDCLAAELLCCVHPRMHGGRAALGLPLCTGACKYCLLWRIAGKLGAPLMQQRPWCNVSVGQRLSWRCCGRAASSESAQEGVLGGGGSKRKPPPAPPAAARRGAGCCGRDCAASDSPSGHGLRGAQSRLQPMRGCACCSGRLLHWPARMRLPEAPQRHACKSTPGLGRPAFMLAQACAVASRTPLPCHDNI